MLTPMRTSCNPVGDSLFRASAPYTKNAWQRMRNMKQLLEGPFAVWTNSAAAPNDGGNRLGQATLATLHHQDRQDK